MPENEPVRRYEFDLWRGEMDRRITHLEHDIERLEEQHDKDIAELARERRDRGRWRWEQVVAAVAAAALVGALWLQARGH